MLPPRAIPGSSIFRRWTTTARAMPISRRACPRSRTRPRNWGGSRRPTCARPSKPFSIPTPIACRRPRHCCPAMLKNARIGLKVDVDTLRGTREGVPRLAALLKKHGVDATFYFSVGTDHTGRAVRRGFRKGFAQKVARTSVLKHYGLKTLLYGVLLPGPDIAQKGGARMRAVRDAGLEVGLHTYAHVRWQDAVAQATPDWTRVEFERGLRAFEKVFGSPPESYA